MSESKRLATAIHSSLLAETGAKDATYYALTVFDVFYLTTIFMIVYIALLFLHEKYLKYRYKDFFTHMLSNPKKDRHT